MSDTIYRQDAINVLEKLSACEEYGVEVGTDEETYIGKYEAITAISDLSSADRPQGEWVDAEIPLESGDTLPIQVCNLCKTFYPLAYTGGGHRFCPNCGARMKGVDDETD